MNNISILDCTLRDGGYINDWNFGKHIIRRIISNLTEANIDIIESGFMSDINYNQDYSLFSDTKQIEKLMPTNRKSTMYVAMIALGEKEIEYTTLPDCDGNSITGIRLTFHKKEVDRAIEFANGLMAKGYKVFIQPVGTMTYTDIELLQLIDIVNKLNPFAFYIVDTLGCMYKNDLLRLFYLVDNNLRSDIKVGFHSHNNLQLSFSNAQELMKVHTKRKIILDSSVFGMGRGAGNLCTELIAQYVNDNIGLRYEIIPLVSIIDDYLMPIKSQKQWGYSMPYCIAATHKCHPNYATYLTNKQTISIKGISAIVSKIPPDKRDIFDKTLVENAYYQHQQHNIDDSLAVTNIAKLLSSRDVLVLAPGKSLTTEFDIISKFIDKTKPVVISVNFVPTNYKQDLIFISNTKRLDDIDTVQNLIGKDCKLIVSSNITTQEKENIYVINYSDYLINNDMVADNAALMLLKLLKKVKVSNLYFAGLDGFSENVRDNYFDRTMINNVDTDVLKQKNIAMKDCLDVIVDDIPHSFITTSQYNK